ncbi:MAG: hypothetical protein IBJ11_05765 [Phycisphaerales bacterium]|nr:hypothetical protein [Phycisphaerales bacterium]
MKNRSSRLAVALCAVAGTAVGVNGAPGDPAPQPGVPFLVNISGATLQQNFFLSLASTNDFLDVDGDGNSIPLNGVVDQLAPAGLNPFNANAYWQIQYRATGSVNGFIELRDFGVTPATVAGGSQLRNVGLDGAWLNRTQFFVGPPTSSLTGPFNNGNPGSVPLRGADAAGGGVVPFSALYTLPPTPSTTPNTPVSGSVLIDINPLDVPSFWAVNQTGGIPAPNLKPGQAGYGGNPASAVNRDGTFPAIDDVGDPQVNALPGLGSLNFNRTSPDANTVFDTEYAYAPVAMPVNFGTGVQTLEKADVRHLLATGRLPSGENLVMITRDVGSGTRNAFCNGVGLDPSFGVGENVGGRDTAAVQQVLGQNWIPSNKGGSGTLETALINCRLGLGMTGAERGIRNNWLTNGSLEVVGVRNDGGTSFVRPTMFSILGVVPVASPQTDPLVAQPISETYRIGGVGVLASVGDPRNQNELGGDATNVNPRMRNTYAAAYLNNFSRSRDSAVNLPGASVNDFSPGQFLLTAWVPPAAMNYIPDGNNTSAFVVNPVPPNTALQRLLLTPAPPPTGANSVLNNRAFVTYGNAAWFSPRSAPSGRYAGLIPARQTGGTYTDGGTTGFISEGGTNLVYGQTLPLRNLISGDFNGDGRRDINDASDLARAFRKRAEGGTWTAPGGSGALLTLANQIAASNSIAVPATPGTDFSIEIVGDFNGDGSFTREDLRYWADGLGVDAATRRLNRKAAFAAIDNAYTAAGGTLGNLFPTTFSNLSKTYAAGDARGDVSNPQITSGARRATRGNNPTGFDGRVDCHDVTYVMRNWKSAASGAVTWTNLTEAANADLSADMNGDRAINEADIFEIVSVILGTSRGDVNLDGVVNAADITIINANLGATGASWCSGDLNGDGRVDNADLRIARVFICPGNVDGDGGVGANDLSILLASFGTTVGQPGYDFRADLDSNGSIGANDLSILLSNFGASCP